MDLRMKLPDAVEYIIEKLTQTGYEAYVVGGSVRDSLIGRELGDFDITTSALPSETKAVFSDCRTVDTGMRHGTVSVIIDRVPYEITTYRIDGDYKDNRHPDTVDFTDKLSEDLKRRDFTVNAMCYSHSKGFVDLFGGVEDIKKRLIRAVGDPYVRFDEDALRILRALRFSSVLDFDIEKKTADALVDKRELLVSVSRERIYTELKKLMMGKRPSSTLIEYADVFSVILDGINVKNMPKDEAMADFDYKTRLAAIFLLNCDNPPVAAERVLTDLKTDKQIRVDTVSCLSCYPSCDFSSDEAILLSMAEMGDGAVRDVLSLGLLTNRFTAAELERFESLNERNPVYRISQLAVSGIDVSELGLVGEEIGSALSRLLFAVIKGECENTRASLLSYLTK